MIKYTEKELDEMNEKELKALLACGYTGTQYKLIMKAYYKKMSGDIGER